MDAKGKLELDTTHARDKLDKKNGTSFQLFCQYCGNFFSSFIELNKHTELEHDVDDSKNNVTELDTIHTRDELDNMKTDGRFQLFCHYCGNFFSSFIELNKHAEEEHDADDSKNNVTSSNTGTGCKGPVKQSLSESGSEVSKTKAKGTLLKETKRSSEAIHKCQFCEATFKDRKDFEKHVQGGHDLFHSKRMYKCPYCLYLGNTSRLLSMHIKRVHSSLDQSGSAANSRKHLISSETRPDMWPYVKMDMLKLPLKLPDGVILSKSKDDDARKKLVNIPEKRVTNKHGLLSESTDKKTVKKEMVQNDISADNKDTVTDMILDENKCPSCEFHCKRASALKFHIDFNHKGERKPSNKRKAEENLDKRQVKKQKFVQITLESPAKNTTDSQVTNKLRMKKLDAQTDKVSSDPSQFGESKDNSQETKDEADRKNIGDVIQSERVFIIDKNGMQETEKEKIHNIQREAEKASLFEKYDAAKNESNSKKWIRTTNSTTGEVVLLEEEAPEPEIESGDEGDDDDDYLNEDTNAESDAENISYICPVCNRQFKWLDAAKQHIKSMHPREKLRTCDIISLIPKYWKRTERANKNESLFDKISEKTKKTSTLKFKCPFCGSCADQMKDIKAHIEAVHKNKDIKEVSNNAEVVSGKETTKNKVGMKMNEKSTASGVHQCPFCPLSFQQKQMITAHVRKFHQNIAVALPSDGAEQVSTGTVHEKLEQEVVLDHMKINSQVYASGSNAENNETKILNDNGKSIETDETSITIIYTDENGAFKDVTALDKDCEMNAADSEKTGSDSAVNERQIQDGDHKPEGTNQDKVKNYRYCELCKKKFKSYPAYWNHNMVTHMVRGKPFKCGSCSKAFVFQHQKNHHEKKHAEEKPMFSCDHEGCKSVYGERKGLYRHLKMKHGESDPANRFGTKKEKKVYVCKECNIQFKNPSSHWRHELRFHTENSKKHDCKICSRSFLFAHELKDHMFVHIHTADIQCPSAGCHFKTKKLKYLGNHLRLQHGQKVDIKTLGQHVLSEEQITAGELLDLFSSPKIKEEPSVPKHSSGTEVDGLDKAIQNTAETEDIETVEPDKQIEMLEASLTTPLDSKTNKTPDSNTKETEESVKVNITDSIGDEAAGSNKEITQTDTAGDFTVLPEVQNVTHVLSLETPTTEELRSTQDSQENETGGNVYKCKTCSEIFPTHRQLIKHKASDHPEDLTMYKCDDCDKLFFTQYDLKDHRAYHHPDDKIHVCEECGKSFPVLSALHRHLNRHRERPVEVNNSEQGEAICDLCGLSLRFRASLKQHMLRVHPETVTCSCKICSSVDDILETVNEAVRVKLPFCSMCNTYFCKKPIYESHMRVVHNTTGRHSCNFCTEKFSNLSQRNFHMHQVHTIPEPEAPEGTDVGQLSTLNDDTQIIEINNEDQSGPKFLPKLSEQGLKAVSKELKIYSEEGGKKHWKCLLCAQSFSKVKYFNLHVRRTHVLPEHQPYRCKICSAGFVRVGEFRKHTRSHSGFRPLKCRTCYKSFKQQAHLRDHMLTHSDTRKYKCELCQGRFKQRGALLAHVVKHDKLRPFKCHFCGVGYTVRGALSKHMKKYIGKQDADGHLCHICHKSFSHYPMLLRHIHIHQAPKPFICETCNEPFAAYTSLYFHKLKEKHFRTEEYETESKRKYVRKGTEVNDAVNSLQLGEGHVVLESESIDQVNKLTVRQVTDGTDNQETVEIIVKSSGTEEGTTAFEVETHTDEELLSIAKQLTEMSTYPGHETYADVEEQRKIEEEEKIMMTMLDADDEVKINLERHLMLSKIDNERNVREPNTKVENTYVQILQYVDENGVTIENVDENGIPVEHVVETHVPVSIDEGTVKIQHVDENGIQIQQANGNNVPVEYVDENGERIQHVYVDEHGIPIEQTVTASVAGDTGAQSISETSEQGNPSDNNNADMKITYHVVEDANGLRIINFDTSANEEESMHNEICSPVKEFEDHVIIAEGKIVESSGFPSDKSEVEVQSHTADTEDSQTNEIAIPSAVYERSNIQVSDEFHNNQQNDQMESVNQECSNLEQSVNEAEPDKQTYTIEYSNEGEVLSKSKRYPDTHIVTETGESEDTGISNAVVVGEEKSVVYTSQLAKALTEDNFNVSYTQSKQNIIAQTAALVNEIKESQEVASTIVESVDAVLHGPPSTDKYYEEIQEVASNIVENVEAQLHEQVEAQSYEGIQEVATNVENVEVQLHEQQVVAQSYEGIQEVESNVENIETQLHEQQVVAQSYEGIQEVASDVEAQLHEQQIVTQSYEGIQEVASNVKNVEAQLHEQEVVAQSYEEIQEVASTAVENAGAALPDQPIIEQFYEGHNVADTDIGQNQNEVSEKIDLNGLTLMDMSEYTPPPEVGDSALLFKKPDGSLVYICVGEEKAGNITESSKEIPSSNAYLEEQDTLDHSTLEAAENLQSFAGTTFLKVSNVNQQIQKTEYLHIYGNMDTAEISPGHPLFDAVNNSKMMDNLDFTKKMVKSDNSSAMCIVYECPLCKLHLKTKKNLRDHLKRHNSVEDREFSCTECPKRFVTRTELERHTRIHSDARPCECNICGKRFRQPGHLLSHKRLHTGEKPYGCDQCPAKFTTSSLLKTHLLVHSDERNFECTICEQKFKAMKDLKRHRAVHSGIVGKMKKLSETKTEENSNKKAICHICGKGFKNKYTLKAHLAAEENLREYKCEDCDLAFNSKSGLHYHRQTHKTKDLEVCKVCGKSFKRTENLKHHMKVIHRDMEGSSRSQGQSLFPCPACNKQFNHRGALYYHIGISPDCMAKGNAELGSNMNDKILINPMDSESAKKGIQTDNKKQVAVYRIEENDEYNSDSSMDNIDVENDDVENADDVIMDDEKKAKRQSEELNNKMSTIIVIAKPDNNDSQVDSEN